MLRSVWVLTGVVLLGSAAAAWSAPAVSTVITRRSAGPVRLGMTLRQVRHAAPGLKLERTSDGEGVALIRVRQGKADWMTLYADEDDPRSRLRESAKVEHIEVTHPSFRTVAGVRPGMRLSEVERRYGKLKRIERSEIEAREFAAFPRQPAGFSFRLSAPDGFAGEYARGSATTRARRSARLHSIIIDGRP